MFNQLRPALDGNQLEAARRAPQGGWDVYPDVLYSTISVPQAGQAVGVPLKFFQGAETVPSDTSLTNVPQGTLPGGQRFHAQKLFVVPLIETTTVTPNTSLDGSGLVRDVDRVFKTNRPQISWTQTAIQRSRGPFPLDAIGEQGGIQPDFGGNNAPAATNNAVYQHARLATLGGWPLDLIIFETETFPFNLTFGAQNALVAAMMLQVRLFGWRYIKVG